MRDATGRSQPSLGMANATADEARLRSLFPIYDPITPRIVNVTVEDLDNGDSGYGVGDTITVGTIEAGEGVRLTQVPETLIAQVTIPKLAVEDEEVEGEVEEGAADEAGEDAAEQAAE